VAGDLDIGKYNLMIQKSIDISSAFYTSVCLFTYKFEVNKVNP